MLDARRAPGLDAHPLPALSSQARRGKDGPSCGAVIAGSSSGYEAGSVPRLEVYTGYATMPKAPVPYPRATRPRKRAGRTFSGLRSASLERSTTRRLPARCSRARWSQNRRPSDDGCTGGSTAPGLDGSDRIIHPSASASRCTHASATIAVAWVRAAARDAGRAWVRNQASTDALVDGRPCARKSATIASRLPRTR